MKKSSDEGNEGRGRRDEYKFSRKVHPQFKFINDEPNLTSGSNDDDFDGLTPITIQKPNKRRRSDEDDEDDDGSDSDIDVDSESWDDFVGKQVVPPTLLHFEIILEAYMGYNLSSSSTTGCVTSASGDDNATSQSSYYHHPDSSIPRSAVMGGAVVAALTAYRDKMVVRAFDQSGLFTEEGALQIGDVQYWSRKMALLKSLHTHFIYKKKIRTYYDWGFPAPPVSRQPCNSKYSDGDVDIFLQASPLSQGIVQALHERGIGDHISLIGSYVGNAGLCDADLGRYAKGVMNDAVQPRKPSDYPKFAYTVSKNAVSFILGKDYRDDTYGNQYWPRTSQFILLDAQADLLGGLMDFDLSVAACSYDGVSVRVVPRAALSLMINAQFITPFCLEEHRNKRRVIKYARRGFKPFLVDPYDNRPQQKVACDAEIMRRPFVPPRSFAPRSSRYEARGPDGDARRNEILRIQDMKGGPKAGRFCCHTFDGMDGDMLLGHDARNTYRYEGIKYTQMLFEISEGDALDFFSKRFNWTEEDLQTVKTIDPHCRMACRRCKNEYLLVRVVMKQFPSIMEEYELEEDNLRGDFSYQHTHGQPQGHFSPSFYSGGVFSSTHSRDNARRTVEIVSMLRAQSIFEVSSYVLKNGFPDGYKKRFVYGSDDENGQDYEYGLPGTLEKASRTPLQEPKRPPIGLNPERFVERCGQCKSWLLGNRYGTKDCQRCSSSQS